MQKNSILITAYENVEQTLSNIKHLRSFLNWPIVVVSTSHKPEIIDAFNNLQYTQGVQPLLVKCIDAPGNPNYEWASPKIAHTDNGEVEQKYVSWRHEFIPPRIFLSMQIGFNLLLEMGCNIALHLHSDTFWNNTPEALKQLEEECNEVYRARAMIWDLCIEDSGNNIHPHPEAIIADLEFLREKGILNLFGIYSGGFEHYNWGSPESLLGSWCYFNFFDKPILSPNQETRITFRDYFKARCKREYHGQFTHITNIAGTQPDVTDKPQG